MDRIEGERRAARRPEDQPETEGSRASRSRRSVTVRSGRLICKKGPPQSRKALRGEDEQGCARRRVSERNRPAGAALGAQMSGVSFSRQGEANKADFARTIRSVTAPGPQGPAAPLAQPNGASPIPVHQKFHSKSRGCPHIVAAPGAGRLAGTQACPYPQRPTWQRTRRFFLCSTARKSWTPST